MLRRVRVNIGSLTPTGKHVGLADMVVRWKDGFEKPPSVNLTWS